MPGAALGEGRFEDAGDEERLQEVVRMQMKQQVGMVRAVSREDMGQREGDHRAGLVGFAEDGRFRRQAVESGEQFLFENDLSG